MKLLKKEKKNETAAMTVTDNFCSSSMGNYFPFPQDLG